MLQVRCQEQPRRFDLKIGERLVGRLEVYVGNGKVAAYASETAATTPVFCGAHDTIRAAANAALRHLGYGNSAGVEVYRAHGGTK